MEQGAHLYTHAISTGSPYRRAKDSDTGWNFSILRCDSQRSFSWLYSCIINQQTSWFSGIWRFFWSRSQSFLFTTPISMLQNQRNCRRYSKYQRDIALESWCAADGALYRSRRPRNGVSLSILGKSHGVCIQETGMCRLIKLAYKTVLCLLANNYSNDLQVHVPDNGAKRVCFVSIGGMQANCRVQGIFLLAYNQLCAQKPAAYLQ